MKKPLLRVLLVILTLTLIIVPLSACADKTDDEPAATTTAASTEPDRDLEMKKTKGYGCFLLSPLEREVYNNFKAYISKNKRV